MSNTIEREAVIIPEKKEKIERIKKKYRNLQMDDDTAKKIIRLEITNDILKAATGIVGIAAVIDWCIADPIPAVDEAILSGATGLLGLASSIVDKKIGELAETGNTEVMMEEVTELSDKLVDVAKKGKEAYKYHKVPKNN